MRWFKKSDKQIVQIEPVKDISEPVYSFVKCVRNNPKRFKLEDCEDDRTSTLTDTITGEVFEFRILIWNGFIHNWWRCFAHMSFLPCDQIDIKVINANFLTKDEVEYLFEEIRDIYEEKWRELLRLRSLRRQRQLTNERNRLKGVYCVNPNN